MISYVVTNPIKTLKMVHTKKIFEKQLGSRLIIHYFFQMMKK